MSRLLPGFQAFQATEFPALRKHYDRLQEDQRPKALFITCSDAPIGPGRLTQTLPGELLVIRNAGNIVPTATDTDGVMATIELAVNGLKVPEVIVCGHSNCEAMKALLNAEQANRLPTMKSWVGRQDLKLEATSCDDAADAVWQASVNNVRLQLTRLGQIPCVASAIAANRLALSGWCYQFETGTLYVVEEETGDAQAIAPPATHGPRRSRLSSPAIRGIHRGGL